jgi:hypothetical protein
MMPAIVDRALAKRLAVASVIVGDVQPFGPCGILARTLRASDRITGSVIVTQADHDGVDWLHASIAWQDRDPNYAELAALHAGVFGRRRWAYQVFAPTTEHVNIHEHALHLFGRVDGAPALPDFTHGTRSI